MPISHPMPRVGSNRGPSHPSGNPPPERSTGGGPQPSRAAGDPGTPAPAPAPAIVPTRTPSSTSAPGAAGSDPGTKHALRRLRRARSQSEYSHILKSLDPAILAIAVEQFLNYNCANEDPETLREMLKIFAEDLAPSVGPPQQQAQVRIGFVFFYS